MSIRSHPRLAPPADPGHPEAGTGTAAGLEELLAKCVAEHVISPGQAEGIAEVEARGRQARAAARASLVTEGLGYFGGVLVLVAGGLTSAQIWDEVSFGVRLALLAAAATLLLAAGAVVPAQRLGPPGHRIRGVLWLVSTGLFTAFLAVLGHDGFGWQDDDTAVLAAAGAATYGAVLWWAHRSVLQHLAVLVAACGTAAATAALVGGDALPGLGIWGVGLAWFLLGRGSLVAPRRVALLGGSVAGIVGADATMASDAGVFLGVATALAVVAAGILLRDLLVLAVGAVGTLVVLPGVVDRWFGDSPAAALGLLAFGLALVAAAVHLTRRSPK